MFASREDAGKRLGQYLRTEGIQAQIVLGLPRGGVIVAAEVAKVLRLPLDALVVRKIGHPRYREYAVGALAEGDVTVLDQPLVQSLRFGRDELLSVIAQEKERLRVYEGQFHPDGAASLAGKVVLLVDDGLATGATAWAAVISAQRRAAQLVVVAAPVASPHAVQRLRQEGAEVHTLRVDPGFQAVGRYYAVFSQTSDAEVIALLRGAYCNNLSTLWGN